MVRVWSVKRMLENYKHFVLHFRTILNNWKKYKIERICWKLSITCIRMSVRLRHKCGIKAKLWRRKTKPLIQKNCNWIYIYIFNRFESLNPLVVSALMACRILKHSLSGLAAVTQTWPQHPSLLCLAWQEMLFIAEWLIRCVCNCMAGGEM